MQISFFKVQINFCKYIYKNYTTTIITERDILITVSDFLNEEIKIAFEQQGHTLTGIWEDSLSATSYSPDELEVWAKSYGAIVDAGVSPGRIPFGGEDHYGTGGVGIRGSGENETFHPISKYIQGLFNFWKLRKPGLSDKEALSLAFATAKVQKKEGMSTMGSRAYSQTGERQNFVAVAFQKADEEAANIAFTGMVQYVNETLNEEQTIIF